MKRKLSLSLKHLLGVVALFLAATHSAALTLGRVRGAAILGQNLEVSVPVQVATDEDASGLCFNADVYYGDNRVDPARVQVSSEPAAQGADVQVRVTVRIRVDEPVVTVYIRSGCGLQTTRKYVLLADMPSEPAAPSPVVRAQPVLPVASVPLPSEGGNKAQANAATDGRANAAKPAATAGTAVSAPKKPAKTSNDSDAGRPSQDAGAKVKPQTTRQRAKLKLEALDLSVEWDPTLKFSDDLRTEVREDAKLRADATTIWKALNASPEDVLRNAEHAQAMEAQVRQLQQQTAGNQKSIADLASRLDKAEAERYANPVIYGLIVALSFLLVGAYYLLRRRATQGANASPWWRGEYADESSLQNSVLGLDETASTFRDSKVAEVQMSVKGRFESQAEKTVEMPAYVAPTEAIEHVSPDSLLSAFAVQSQSSQGAGQRDFAHSSQSGMRSIKAKELVDVRHQADFYVALGQYDAALGVLEGHIRDAQEADPLVYLDLLNVLHTLSRKPVFDEYREKFNAYFTGFVPEFETYSTPSEPLESYAQLCAQIAELWPTPDALHYIERCLVRDPLLSRDTRMSLDAFRDLLMLHGVLTRVMSPTESILAPFSIKPQAPGLELIAVPPRDSTYAMPPATPELDLELDLDLTEQSNNLIEMDQLKPR